MSNSKILRYVLSIFIGWRIILLTITFFGLNLLPTFNFVNSTTTFSDFNTQYWTRWANWDGEYFLNIAEDGYILTRTPFFPLYSILIKIFTYITFSTFWAAFIITQISTIIALFFFYKLASLEYEESIARKAVFLFLAFPTSFYLGATYSESLFLTLTFASFYFMRKQNWLIAALFAGLSATTRLGGIAVIIALFSEYFLDKSLNINLQLLIKPFINRVFIYLIAVKFILDLLLTFGLLNFNWLVVGITLTLLTILFYIILVLFLIIVIYFLLKHFNYKKLYEKNSAWLFISFIPLGLYCLYLYFLLGDTFAFLKGHENWGRKFTFPTDTIFNHYQLISSHFYTLGYRGQLLLEFFTLIFLLILFGIGLFKLRTSYLIFFATSLLIPLISGKLMSFPRIALAIFPIYFILSNIKDERIYNLWLMISLTLLGILSVLFINSYWVA